MKQILVLAWPPAVQMLGTFLVTVIFIRMMGDFGDTAQTAYSIGLRLGMLAPMICFPLAGAVSTLVGQALGSRNVPRAWRSIRVGLTVQCSLMWSLAVMLYFTREILLRIFTDDPEVIAIGSRMLAWQAASFVPLAFSFVFFRALQGAGDVMVPMLISIANALLLTLPLGVFLSHTRGMGPDGLFIAQFASAIVGTSITGAWVATGRWTRIRSAVELP
jgi:Na+-driven multidrug efflux pump